MRLKFKFRLCNTFGVLKTGYFPILDVRDYINCLSRGVLWRYMLEKCGNTPSGSELLYNHSAFRFKWYSKPTASQRVMAEASAAPLAKKRTVLTQEGIKRLLNCSEELRWAKKTQKKPKWLNEKVTTLRIHYQILSEIRIGKFWKSWIFLTYTPR